jgi:hypothetical protein
VSRFRSSCMTTNPLDRQQDLMDLLRQDTRHSIVQMLLGHPKHLASADKIDYFVSNKSMATVDEQLDVLVDAGILGVYEFPRTNRPGDSRGCSMDSLPQGLGFWMISISCAGQPWHRPCTRRRRKQRKSNDTRKLRDLPETVREAFELG